MKSWELHSNLRKFDWLEYNIMKLCDTILLLAKLAKSARNFIMTMCPSNSRLCLRWSGAKVYISQTGWVAHGRI